MFWSVNTAGFWGEKILNDLALLFLSASNFVTDPHVSDDKLEPVYIHLPYSLHTALLIRTNPNPNKAYPGPKQPPQDSAQFCTWSTFSPLSLSASSWFLQLGGARMPHN